MTDFYSVLQRAIASLPDGSGPQRRAVYDKARKALLKQLQSFDPPLPSSDVTAQRLALEDAIRKIENEIARQIRARRAVQGALPAAGTARPAGSPPAAPAPPQVESPARPTPPAPPAPTPEERQAQREQQAEALTSAVTAATAQVPEPVPESQPEANADADLEPEHEPERRSVDTDALAGDIIASTTPAEQDEWFGTPAARRGPADPRHDALGFDGDGLSAQPSPSREAEVAAEPEDEEPDAEAPAAPAVSAPPRRDRREEKRQRKEAERAAKAAERERKKAARRQRKAVAKPTETPRKEKAKGSGRSVAARALLPLIVLALLVGASYAAYTQRATLLAMLDELSAPQIAETRAPIRDTSAGVAKNTDRLPTTLDGEETRPVTTTTVRSTPQGDAPATTVREVAPPANDAPAETQAAVTPPAAPAETSAPAATPDSAIGEIGGNASQQAVLYEEASQSGEQGRATAGQVEWSMVRQSVAGGEPEPVVRADTRVAGRNMIASITIRENRDSALPASHLIEIEIDQTGPDGDDPVKSIPGIIMKETEQARGEALRGAAARVSSGLFWVALSENPADRESNLALLRERDWIDIPILYESGRRAILTLRKGNEGVQSVNAALQAWSPG